MKIKLDEPMKIDVFMKLWEAQLNSFPNGAFIDNLKNHKDQTYTEWIKTWLAWNELGSDEDVDNYYGGKGWFIEIDEDNNDS